MKLSGDQLLYVTNWQKGRDRVTGLIQATLLHSIIKLCAVQEVPSSLPTESVH